MSGETMANQVNSTDNQELDPSLRDPNKVNNLGPINYSGMQPAKTTSNSQSNLPQSSTLNPGQSGSSNVNKQIGTGFSNIDNILNANRKPLTGVPTAGYTSTGEGTNLGGIISSGVSGITSSINRNLKKQKEEFDKQITSAGSSYDPSKRDSIINQVLTGNNGTIKPSQAQVNQFKSYLNGTYTGPSVQTQDKSSAMGALKNIGTGLQTSGGRESLLRQFVSNPSYTQGQSSLDSILLGNSKNPSFATIRQEALNSGRNIQKQEGQLSNQENAARQQAKQFADQTRNVVAGKESAIEQAIQQNMVNKQQTQQSINNLISSLSPGKLITGEDATAAGLDMNDPAIVDNLNKVNTMLRQVIQQDERTRTSAYLGGSSGVLGTGFMSDPGVNTTRTTHNITQKEMPIDWSSFLANYANKEELNKEQLASKEQLLQMNALEQLMGNSNKYTEDQIAKSGQSYKPYDFDAALSGGYGEIARIIAELNKQK